MTPTEAARYVQAIALDAAVLRVRCARAFDLIDRSRGGYPSAASGADGSAGGERTMVIDGEQIPVTVTEAAALGDQRDPAAEAQSRLARELPRVASDIAALAKLITAWTPEDLLPGRWSNAADQLAQEDIWCPNHRRYGGFEVKAEGRKLCRWCDDVQRDTKSSQNPNGLLPDADLIERRQRHGRLSAADYDAFRARAKAKRKGKRKAAA